MILVFDLTLYVILSIVWGLLMYWLIKTGKIRL